MDLLLISNHYNPLNKYNVPNYLLNIDTKNCLYYNIHYWIKYVSRIFLVIHTKYKNITYMYIKYFLQEYEKNIIIIIDDNENVNSSFIITIINNKLINYEINDLLISTIYTLPDQKIDFNFLSSKNTNKVYIFTYEYNYLYNFENKIIKTNKNNGNVIGIYLIKNYKFHQIDDTIIHTYFEDYLNNLGVMFEVKLEKIKDYNNIDIDTNYLHKNININNICYYDYIIENNKILKKSKQIILNNSIKREIIFYKYIQKYDKLQYLFPKLLHFYENAYVIEYNIDYKKLVFINNNTHQENERIILKLLDTLNILHNTQSINLPKLEFLNNLKIETYQEIINSIKIIDPILQSFPKFKKINNIYIDSFQKIIDKFSKFIFNYYDTLDTYQYFLIHGNAYFSNILINNEENILFIEPKGYYGNTQTYGLKEYDYSKILLSIYIYNYFNIENISNDELTFHNSKIELSNLFIKKHFNKIHYILLVLQLFKLAEYNKNDPFNCILCYYYGLYLGTLL